MTGFLHSLAVHGTAPGSRLRPIAAPFARIPLSSDRLDRHEVNTDVMAVPAASPLPDMQDPRAVIESVDKDDASRREPMTVVNAIVHLTDPPRRRREVQPPSAADPGPQIDSLPVAAREPQPRSSIPMPAARLGHAAPRPARTGRDRTEFDNDRRINPTVATTPGIPRVTAPRIAEQRSDLARHRRESGPDVHIHIGRIELTAVTPPAAPRRQQPAAAKAAMPLDEYLQRRNGRRG